MILFNYPSLITDTNNELRHEDNENTKDRNNRN